MSLMLMVNAKICAHCAHMQLVRLFKRSDSALDLECGPFFFFKSDVRNAEAMLLASDGSLLTQSL